MKKFSFAIIVCLFIALPSMANPYSDYGGGGYDGGTAYWTRENGYYSGDGGEFTVYCSSSNISNDAYASSTSGLGSHIESFQTFCLEKSETAYNGANVWVSTEFVNGDPGSHAYEGGIDKEHNGPGDNLDPRTAYLYTQFATGVLGASTADTFDDYDYDDETVKGRDYSAEQLQLAIWYIENEITYLNINSQAWKWVQEAGVAVKSGAWTGIGDVRVLQMYTGSDCHCRCGSGYDNKQDFLYLECQPVPAPAAVLLGMLGMGVAGIKLRKFA